MKTISLRAARVNAGLRQSDVERKLGYSRSTLTRWETGKCIPRRTPCGRCASCTEHRRKLSG